MAVLECPDGQDGTAQMVEGRGYRPATTHGYGGRDAAGWDHLALSGKRHPEWSGDSAKAPSGEQVGDPER